MYIHMTKIKPAYLLALKLGIPIIVQPAWDDCQKLREEGGKLWEKGWKLWDGRDKIWENEEKLWNEGRELDPKYIDRIDWNTGEVKVT